MSGADRRRLRTVAIANGLNALERNRRDHGRAGATVTFFGGLSMFRKLGACVEVASRWPIRASVGTHTNTTTLSRTAARASASVEAGRPNGQLPKAIAVLL